MNRFKILISSGVLIFALVYSCIAVPTENSPNPRLGINLAGPCDWNTELPFADLMHFSRKWSGQAKGKPFGDGPLLQLDTEGYPLFLEEGTWAESPLLTFEGHPKPSGRYLVTWKGEGKISFGGSSKSVVKEESGRMIVDLDPGTGNLNLSILQTNTKNPVRSISIVKQPPDNEAAPWSARFLARWRGIACFRFMNFMATNNSLIRTWAERPHLGDASYALRGVPLELLIDLCNRQHADGWFCIPHQADDDFVRQFAAMIRKGLNPGLKVYLEYSNEVWNSGFQQHRYATEKGLGMGLSKDPAEAEWLFTAKRSLEIFKIFEEEFGGAGRLVRILPAQAGNPWMAQRILSYPEAARHADALAIAPYVGLNVGVAPSKYNPITSGEVSQWRLEKLFDYLNKIALPQVLEGLQKYGELARSNHLALIAYEGGQHLVGIAGAENDPLVTELFLKANGDRRMGDLYTALLSGWKDSGGGLFCHFSSISKWNKWGSWGLMQWYDEDPSLSPKFRAVRKWALEQGQQIGDR